MASLVAHWLAASGWVGRLQALTWRLSPLQAKKNLKICFFFQKQSAVFTQEQKTIVSRGLFAPRPLAVASKKTLSLIFKLGFSLFSENPRLDCFFLQNPGNGAKKRQLADRINLLRNQKAICNPLFDFASSFASDNNFYIASFGVRSPHRIGFFS